MNAHSKNTELLFFEKLHLSNSHEKKKTFKFFDILEQFMVDLFFIKAQFEKTTSISEICFAEKSYD